MNKFEMWKGMYLSLIQKKMDDVCNLQKGNFFKVNKCPKEIDYNNLTILPIKNEVGIVGWHVKLCSIPNKDRIQAADVTMTKKSNRIVGFPKKRNRKHYSFLHRGHLLGKMFQNFIIISGFNFNKNNPNNIIVQTERANCNSHNDHGQLYFENCLYNKLVAAKSSNKEIEIYYRVEALYNDSNDVIPIGTYLYSRYCGIENNDVIFNVFIPNYQEYEVINYSKGFK